MFLILSIITLIYLYFTLIIIIFILYKMSSHIGILSSINEINDAIKSIDFNDNEDQTQNKEAICKLLNINKSIKNESSNENEKDRNKILKDLLKLILDFFPDRKSNITDSKPLLSGSLANQDNFNIHDYIFLRIIYTYIMYLESKKLDGISFAKKFYEEYFRFSLEDENNQLKEVELVITFNNKQINLKLFKNILTLGRLKGRVDVEIAEETDQSLCSRLHGMIVQFINKDGKPTIAIIDPGSLLGISKKNIRYSVKEQVFYLEVINNNEITLEVGEIIINFCVKTDN